MDELMTRTKFPSETGEQPGASTFQTLPVDLALIKGHSAENRSSWGLEVYHRDCGRRVDFRLNERDPILSNYICNDYSCPGSWDLRDLLKMTVLEIQKTFYTLLIEDDDDLDDRPIKLIEIDNGRQRYSSTRPCTNRELMESRVKRLVAIREKK